MDSCLTAVVPLVMVAPIDPRLLLVPCVFIGLLVVTVWEYNRRLNPATDAQRETFGKLNAVLADALEGIETVKANLGEVREIGRFVAGAGALRDLYIRIARIQAKYWPLLVFAVCWGLGFLHALFLWRAGDINARARSSSYMLLYNGLRFATFISLWSFNLVPDGTVERGPGARDDQRQERPRRESDAVARREWRAESSSADVSFSF